LKIPLLLLLFLSFSSITFNRTFPSCGQKVFLFYELLLLLLLVSAAANNDVIHVIHVFTVLCLDSHLCVSK